MRRLLAAIMCIFATFAANAQEPISIDLWQDGLPNSNGIDKTEPYDDSKQNFKPNIRVFLPEKSKANGMAVLCLPGGGYSHLATGHEGYDWAPYFNDLGFAFVVLKYRMPHEVTDVPISDAKEALRIVRENAEKWGIKPNKVGIMGSSAGGHLASTVATHSLPGTEPNFQILFYPVISMDWNYTHKWSRLFLIGEKPTKEMVDLYSNDLQVSSNTPPAILLLSDDDKVVPSPNSVNYYLALRRHNVPATMHIYPSGGHGWGCRKDFKYHKEMMADLTAWLKTLK
ncbi:MAG: alpha/beta hydrolase [Bacteroidaceae bacterium]|nr:alpha/beta hydrolase [Bacteroidaceae bacterium]